jgi:ABC-type sugar transport system ATPase subunit
MTALRLHRISKTFGKNRVIEDISFEVKRGEFCILLGPSGCGKSTILRLVAGLERQDSGEIFIGDREVTALTPKERDVAMVFQSYALYPHMTVYENMAFSLRMRKRPKAETDSKVREAASLLGIEELLDRKPKELSGGQRQRVAIGRAIVRSPQLFLFDEPLSNLDARLRTSMRVELARLHQAIGSTTLYVTHDQVEAMTLGDRIVLMDKGIIQQTGTPADLYDRPANIFVASFIGSPAINLLKGSLVIHSGKAVFRCGDISIELTGKNALNSYDGAEVTLGIRPESLSPGPGPVRGKIELVEHLGAEILLHIDAGGQHLIARTSPDRSFMKGEEVSLSIADTGIHIFIDGLRISQP